MIDKLNNLSDLLEKILNGKIYIKKKNGVDEMITSNEMKILTTKAKELIKLGKEKNYTLLVRGTKKKIIRERLGKTLNSNDSLYDGLFLVGEKAKNFLLKPPEVPNPIKAISETNKSVIKWIFEEYSKFSKSKFDPIDIDYFKKAENEDKFVTSLSLNKHLIDYYLFGLHTNNKSHLNFVSSTTNPKIACSFDNDLIILFWMTPDYEDFSVSKKTLNAKKEQVLALELPLLEDSFYPEEDEYSLKGFILPHYIFGVYDLTQKYFVPNPRIFKNKENWASNGFKVNNDSFKKFIKTTKYKRFLNLINKRTLEEENV